VFCVRLSAETQMDVAGQLEISISDAGDINIPGMASPIPSDAVSRPRYENMCTSPSLITSGDIDFPHEARVTQSDTNIPQGSSLPEKPRYCDDDDDGLERTVTGIQSTPPTRRVDSADCPYEAHGHSASGASSHSSIEADRKPTAVTYLRYLRMTDRDCARDARKHRAPGNSPFPRHPSDFLDDTSEHVVSSYARTSTPIHLFVSVADCRGESREESDDKFECAEDDFNDCNSADGIFISPDDERRPTIFENYDDKKPAMTVSGKSVSSSMFTPPWGVDSSGDVVLLPEFSRGAAHKPSWARLTAWGSYSRSILIAIDTSSEAKYAFHCECITAHFYTPSE